MPRHLIRARSGDLSSNHDPSFVQQGEVDWVSLSKALVSLSVGTLKRLSAAGVQEMTYVSALQLGTRFQLQDVGYKRVEEAIEKTSYAPAIGRVAYFGFGYRSFVHLLADFQCGVKFIALCATLQEAHGEDLAARVMSSLWAAVGYPEEYQPSNAQFKCLARACAGVFAETKFLEVVGIMLGSYRRFRQAGKLPETSDPAEIAAVLQGLFDISKGTRTRMEVIGGAECSFIAAIAYWLFELKIQVDDSQGNTLFTSSSESDEAQVYIVYKDAEQLKSVAITRSTYILRDPSEIFRYLPDSELRVIRTRVPWGVCLHRTFGIDFEGLIKLPISLGRFLGGIARVYKALATSEPHLPWLSPGLFVGFVEEGYGQGFIDTMQRLFPELNNPALVGSMEQAVKHTVHNADSGIEEAMLTFQSHCQCSGCRSHGQRMELHEERLCLLGLAITLVELVTALAATERVPQLMLTEKGIFNVYEDSIKYLRGHDITQPLQTLAKALRLHESPGSRAHMTPALMMARTISLFTGYESSKATLETNNYRTAVAENGISRLQMLSNQQSW
ncbi:MAG: hypothetical protein M1828_005432 [Chrysothrix sp. TS-e1954]|nr:MAG: hypothetical protein M1828_005432 [Chrysothrix sp. TS-e1954]